MHFQFTRRRPIAFIYRRFEVRRVSRAAFVPSLKRSLRGANCAHKIPFQSLIVRRMAPSAMFPEPFASCDGRR
jgi:hypothetical protein